MVQKIWLITGVSKGLGREIAKQVVANGDIAVGTVRNSRDKEDYEKLIGTTAFIIDLTNVEQIPTLIKAIINQYGKIDVLVNNAGFGAFGMVEEFSTTEIVTQFNVNFIAVWKLCQAVLPYMRNNGRGTIVQISSRLGILAGTGNGIYASSKFAVEGISEALREEVEPFGIKVLLVEPGGLRTEFFGESVKYADNEISHYIGALGDIRTKTKSVNGKQPGDPVKAANAIINAINKDIPVFRLPLTSGTIESMRAKIAELQNCIVLTEKVAKSVDY